MYVIKLIQHNISGRSYQQRRPKRVQGPNLFPHVAAASTHDTHKELLGSDHPGLCHGHCSDEVCVLVHKSFPKRDELTKCQHKDGLSISCLVPSFRSNPPGSESYCPACSAHTHGQESSRWAQGTEQEVLTSPWGADRGFRCQVKQISWTVLTSARSSKSMGHWTAWVIRAPLILERSSPELLVSISGLPERPLPRVDRNQGYGDYLESI